MRNHQALFSGKGNQEDASGVNKDCAIGGSGCLGVVFGSLEGFFLKDCGIPHVLGGMQASAVIGSTLILRKTLRL